MTNKFVLTGEIEKAIKQDAFLGIIVYGPMRVGKSSYALQTLYQVYHDWDLVLDNTIFRLEDLIAMIERAMETETKVPAVIWDDAGVFGNRLAYFRNRQLVEYLEDLVDTIGLYLHALLMTSPSVLSLLKALRTFEFYRAKCYRRDAGYGRYAVSYMATLLPSGSRLIHRRWRDNFNCRLPDPVWDKYVIKRRSYLKEAVSQLKNLAHSDGHELPAEVEAME